MLLFELEYQLAPVFCIFLFLTLWAGSSVCLWRAQHLNCHASCIHKTSSCSLGFLYLWNQTAHGSQIGSLGPNTGAHVAGGGTTLDPGLEDGASKCAGRLGWLGQVGFAVTSVSLHSGRWIVGGWRFLCLLIGEFARCTLIVNFRYYVLTRYLGIWLGLQSPPLEHSPFQILLLQSGWLTAQIHEW